MPETDDLKTIQKLLREEKLDGERVLAALVRVLVRDHLAERAKANGGAGTTAINHPTVLWNVERVIAERLRDEGGGQGGRTGGKIDPLLGTLAVLLMQCREQAEERAPNKPPGDDRPMMRLVRD